MSAILLEPLLRGAKWTWPLWLPHLAYVLYDAVYGFQAIPEAVYVLGYSLPVLLALPAAFACGFYLRGAVSGWGEAALKGMASSWALCAGYAAAGTLPFLRYHSPEVLGDAGTSVLMSLLIPFLGALGGCAGLWRARRSA